MIDLEQASLADKEVPPEQRFAGWSADALDPNPAGGAGLEVYSRRSDMHQIGVLLQCEKTSLPQLSDNATDFINKLLAKALTVSQALGHPWLVQ